jgi:DNA-binding LacI/PurR family transcriptional regulator
MCIPVIAGASPTNLTLLKQSGRMTLVDSPLSIRVTLRDLANRLSLSHATISMALRDHPSIAEKTRKRVKEEAARCGYHPEPMLSALAAYRQMKRPPVYHGNLAWIYDHKTHASLLSRPLFRLYHEGACKRANELGFQIEEFGLAKTPPGRLSEILMARGVQGILVAPLSQPETRMEMRWDRFSSVALGLSLVHPRLHMVSSAQYRIALVATRRLHELGYRRVGFFRSRSYDQRTDRNFTAGFLSGSMEVPAACRVPPLSIKEEDPEPAISAEIKKWIVRSRVEAVLCSSGLHPLVSGAGLSIPEDVAVALIGCPNNPPLFAGMDENGFLTGVAAVDFLVGMIHRGERGVPKVPSDLLVEGTWIDGGSAPPKTGAPRPCRPVKTPRAAKNLSRTRQK